LKQKIDLILLDVMMPDVDGFLCAKMIKSNKKTKDIPIIFITASKDDATIEKCYEVGGSDYVNKPFNSVELLNRVSFHLKLADKKRLITKEKEFTQSVLDLQDNFIIVADTNQMLHVNKALLHFFSFTTLSDFRKDMGCIANLFIKEEPYFHLNLVENSLSWIYEVLERLKRGDVLVKIARNFQEYIFTLKVAIFHDYYIVTMTDVTTISVRSLEYEHDANFDSLTQIYNRNMFNRLIEKKIYEARLQKSSFVFVIFDIDFFKKVNDTYGHLAGDSVLKEITALTKEHIRVNDIFARWGGEEFVIVLDTDMKKGFEIAESLRKNIERKKFSIVNNITCSFGITDFREKDSLNKMIKRADESLYEAKSGGRNRVCQSS
jgi:diguanylate cyclase (GGDEF)-like protein